MKWLLRRKLKQIHQQLNLLLVYVTHDQTEALTFADRVVVMTEGEVLQTGSAEELFEQPAHRFVGNFIGTPGMNFLVCEAFGNAVRIAGNTLATASETAPPPKQALSVGIRPEYISLAAGPGVNCLPARIVAARDEGTAVMVELDIAGNPAWARLRAPAQVPTAGPSYVHLSAAHCALYADGWRIP